MHRAARLVAILSLFVYSVSVPQGKSQTPVPNNWFSAGQMTQPRSGAAAVQLNDGRILITGGTDNSGKPQATTETFDPSSGTFAPAPAMNVPQVVSMTTGTPTGSITFYDGATLLGTVPLTAGAAALSTSSLTAGTTNVLNAVYSGDNNFTTSNSTTSISVAALDFTLAVSGANSRTVLQGSSATYQVAVTPLYGNYPGPVTFTASGVPSGASVTFSPATIAFNGGNQMVTVTVQTPAQAKLDIPGSGRKMAPLALALLLIPLFGARRLRRQGSRLGRLASIVLLLGCTLAGVVMTGCGSQSGIFTQTEKNYSITVTGTSGNVQRTAPVTLTIQ